MMQLSVFFVCLCAVASAHMMEPLLLVVGDVTSSSVRVLYEVLDPSYVAFDKTFPVSLYIQDKDVQADSGMFVGRQVEEKRVRAEKRPNIVKFERLEPSTKYRVEFGNDSSHAVSFTTQGDTRVGPVKIGFGSCDGYHYRDNDTSLFRYLSFNQKDRNLTVFLGDQVYADWISQTYRGEQHSHDFILEKFRETYRNVWGEKAHQKVLRQGPNYMLPDDHDIINNLDAQMLQDPSLKSILSAGKQAVYEYQIQLRVDLPSSAEDVPVWYRKVIGDTALLMLDTRFERTFNFDDKFPLFGKKQWDWFEKQIQQVGSDPSIHQIVVLTSIPLAFGSRFSSQIAYWFEQEKLAGHESYAPELDRFFTLLRPFHSKVILGAGDVHMYMESRVCHYWSNECIRQFVSSGITVSSTVIRSLHLFLFDLFTLFIGSSFVTNEWRLIPGRVFLDESFVVLNLNENRLQWSPIFVGREVLTQGQKFMHTLVEWAPSFPPMLFLATLFGTMLFCVRCYRRRRRTSVSASKAKKE